MAVLEVAGATLAFVVAVMLLVAVAWGVTRLFSRRRREAWIYGAAWFLITLWVELVATHAALTHIEDSHTTHDHTHWALDFWRSGFENLQSEDWQIWLAALVFAHWYWKGTPESKDPE